MWKPCLGKHALADDYDMAVGGLGNFINVRGLVALLAWITDIYASGGYEVEGFVLLGDVECEEPEIVAVHIKGCGLEEWGAIARSVKQQLREGGFVDLAGRVTIVCVVHSRLSAGG
jgi:hypothetical protein